MTSPAEMKFDMIAAPLPADSRYRALLRRVLERLPDGWDEFRTFGVMLEAGKPRGYACALRYEEIEIRDGEDETHSEQTWSVTLFPECLDSLSDSAVMWAIAHELGHVASGCACGGFALDGRRMTRVWDTADAYREIDDEEVQVNEERANKIARGWGFLHEEAAFEEATRGGA